jgi:hypothetical protein
VIITQLTGGIGNQMFQYALARALSLRFHSELYLDIFSYQWDSLRVYELEAFNIEAKIADTTLIERVKNTKPSLKVRFLHKLKRKSIPSYYFSHIKEVKFSYNEVVSLIPNQSIYLEGYWQSAKYFERFRSVLVNDFRLKNQLGNQAMKYKELIEKSNSSVSVHVRRGDYVQNPETTAYHGVCDLNYYNRAIQKIKDEVSNPTFFIFSDDKEYVKTTFGQCQNCIFIENLDRDVEELALMSICSHNIIANSSFSWWGAWLNENSNKKVIAPQLWFRNPDMQNQTQDLIPKEWIKI